MRLSFVPYSQDITFNNLSSSLLCNQILFDINLVKQSITTNAFLEHIMQRIYGYMCMFKFFQILIKEKVR